MATDGYTTIVVDPPWPQKGRGTLQGEEGFGDSHGGSLPMPYPTMTVKEMGCLPILALASDDAHLYLWTTNGFLRDAFHLIELWGFAYSTTLVWAKAPMGGGLGGDAYGISTEFCLFGRRGRLPAKHRVGQSAFNWQRKYDARGKPSHSTKPPEFFKVVELVSPGPYLEMFARTPRNGWSSWGNEVGDPLGIGFDPEKWTEAA